MPLSTGDQLGPYEILAPLGAGGMGEVYRALDIKLNREVAIKVLPAALSSDAQYMARFEREAQTLAALNHPNIATVYGIEQGALVMELVEGANLRGPLPLEEAIPIFRQLAEGLEAAHERGIVHRDLKPANIKLTPAGVVKILDFGLAKTVGDVTPSSPGASPTISPTLSLAMTQAGMILGTAVYMSPEQARGKPVDKRSDIWAFGVVFYEILTGRQLFGGGETVTDTLASVVKDVPDFNRLPAETPPHIRRLLDRCLRKDVKTRLRDIGEVRVFLDEPEQQAAPPNSRSWMPWALGATALLAIALAGLLWLRPKTSDPGPGVARFLIPLPAGTMLPSSPAATNWVPSPDGRNLAMIAADKASGTNALWVRPLDGTEPHRLDRTEGAMFPFWSPDGQFIGFFSDGKLKRVGLSGGSAQTICAIPGNADRTRSGDGGAWNQDGIIVFAGINGPLLRVPATGGTPQPATALAKGERAHSWPQFLPDGRHFLYLAKSEGEATGAIYVQELGSAQRVQVLQNQTRAMWSPPGYLVFVRETTLFAQHMDPKTFKLDGEPLAVAQDVVANQAMGNRSTFAVSRNGVLAYRNGLSLGMITELTWRDREGKVLAELGKPGNDHNPSLAPDEKNVALLVGGDPFDTWIMQVSGGVLTRVTGAAGGKIQAKPTWSPDSQRLALSEAGGIDVVHLASGKITPLTRGALLVQDWSPDGASILYTDRDGNQLFLLSLADGAKPQLILDAPYNKGSFRFSPDGKYVAYRSLESGTGEIYIAAFPSFAVKRKASSGGGMYLAWARSGKELFYRALDGTMMDVEVRTEGGNIETSIPKPLFKFGTGSLGNGFDVSADGKRFLINEAVQKEEAERPAITLVLNWQADLKQ